jgi:type IX secretion system PorP/SprF family membrane protein
MKLIYIAFLICPFYSLTQQTGIYSNFIFNNYYYNPAVAGSQTVHTANLGYRNQWLGFDNAPTNVNVNINGSLRNEGKIGYGLSLNNENIGLTNATSVYLNYAQHFKIKNDIKFGLGVQAGYLQYRVKLYDAVLADEGDDVLTGSIFSANAFDVNMGFNIYSKKFFVMGAVQHLLGRQLKFTNFNNNLSFHFNTIMGYNFEFKKKNFELQPSLLLKFSDPVPMQWSTMLKGTFKDKYWIGLIYRSSDAIGINAGIKLKERFSIGYGYDYSIGTLRNHNTGSHEVMLSFILTKKKPTLEEEDEKLNNSILEDSKKEITTPTNE